MPETRRRYDPDFREGAVGIVRETGKSVARVARDLGINPGTLASWVARDAIARGECLNRTLILGRRHLETVLAEYVEHYNSNRPHRSLGQRSPSALDTTPALIGDVDLTKLRISDRLRVLLHAGGVTWPTTICPPRITSTRPH